MTIKVIAIATLLILVSGLVMAQGEKISWQVISSGATDATVGTFKILGTASQTATGVSTVGAYKIRHGYWQAFEPVGCDDVPDCFSFTDNTDDSYSIIIDGITLSGGPLMECDEVGVFDDGLCVGAAVFQGSWPLPLTAWHDDPETVIKDGYTDGNRMSFRVRRSGSCFEAEVCAKFADYTDGDGYFGTGFLARMSLYFDHCCEPLEVPVFSGWNFISTNVAPLPTAVADIVAPFVGSVNLIKADDGRFWVPGAPCPSGAWLCEWDVLEGYKVHMSSPATMIFADGECVPYDTPIPLASGWQWISYLPETVQCPDDALATTLACLSIVKDGAGLFWIPGVPCGTPGFLSDMMPGVGYAVHMGCPATLVYPAGSKSAGSAKPVARAETSHFRTSAGTGDFHAVVIESSSEFSVGDEIAVYTSSNRLVGASVYEGGLLAISAWADDPETDLIEGYQHGETMELVLWQAATGEEVKLSTVPAIGSVTLGESPYTWFGADVAGGAVPETFALHANYPNPFNPTTEISFSIPSAGHVTLEVFNTIGQRVAVLVNEHLNAGDHTVEWDGRSDAGSSIASGVYLYRLQAGQLSDTKKMILLK